jgi:hypothetical protein
MKARFVIPLLMLTGLILLGVTCRHEVVTPEPIKIEVTIRQEIHEYVHQVNDVVAGKASAEEAADALFAESPPGNGSSLLRGIERLFISEAYAAEGDAKARYVAALKGRQSRYASVQQYLKDGSVGENHSALLSFRETAKTKADAAYAKAVKATIAAENTDRETIIAIIAAQKGVAASVVREEQFTANVAAAPAGAWVEVKQGGGWVWSQK